MTTRRLFEQLFVPLAILAAFVAPVAAWSDRLPAPIAMHWGASGVADGSGSVNSALWLFMTLWVCFWVFILVMVRVQQVAGREAQMLVAIIYWTGGLLLGVWIVGLAGNLDVARWQDAANFESASLLGAMAASLPLGLLGYWLAAGHPSTPTEGGTAGP